MREWKRPEWKSCDWLGQNAWTGCQCSCRTDLIQSETIRRFSLVLFQEIESNLWLASESTGQQSNQPKRGGQFFLLFCLLRLFVFFIISSCFTYQQPDLKKIEACFQSVLPVFFLFCTVFRNLLFLFFFLYYQAFYWVRSGR